MTNQQTALLQTFLLGLSAACVAIPLGLAMVAVIRRWGVVGRLMLLAMVGQLFFPLFLHVSLWDAAFGRLGWLTSTRGEVLTPIVSSWFAATWIHGIAAAPQVTIIFLLGLSTGSRAYEEQALLDAGRWQVLIHVKLRRILPLVGIAIMWVVVVCSREIAVTDIYRIETLAEQIYLGFSLGALGSVAGAWSPQQLAAASDFQLGWSLLPFFCIALASTYGLIQLTAPSQAFDDWKPTVSVNQTIAFRLVGILLLVLLVIVPFSNVIYRCGFEIKPVDGVAVHGFSWAQVGAVLQRASSEFGNEFFWSTTIATVAASLILVTVIPFCWTARTRAMWRFAYIGLIAMCLTIPGPLIGTLIVETVSGVTMPGLVWLYDRTIFAPALATTIFFWPLAAILVWYLFSQIDQDTVANAQLDGARGFSILWQFGICANAYALLGSWLLTFALCFGELSASQLVLPPGMDTLPRLMLGLLHAGVDEMTAAIAILIAATIIIVSLIAYSFITRKFATTNRHE